MNSHMKFEDAIAETLETVTDFVRCHAIWRELHQPEQARKYMATRNEYFNFFYPVGGSLITNLFVIGYQLFDHNKVTKSFPNLIKELKSKEPILASTLEKAIKSKQPVLKKFVQIRNNVYAHRNRIRDPKLVFSDVGIKIKELKEVIELAEQIIIQLADFSGLKKKDELRQLFTAERTKAKEAAEKVMIGLNHSLVELFPTKYAKLSEAL
jgi:hypothetical protein